MKTVGRRSLFLYLLAGAFFVGIAFFLVRLVMHGNDWASQPYNGHLYTGDVMTAAGDILDRNDEVLATSGEGGRSYAPEELMREALLHTVGDSDGYISTGVQQLYRSELSGYNFFTGLATPTGKSSGNSVKLTVDASLCRDAYELLGGRKGAVFLYNYKTGEVVCKTSSPAYDPEYVPEDIETNEYYEGAYLDRTISVAYTPGSIFKLVTAACAIDNMPDWESFTAHCSGSVTINENEITCLGEHGTIGIADGLMESCNVVFAELAVALGEEKMTETANKLGFNKSFSFNGVDTKKSVYQVEDAEDNELAWSGVGQYKDLTNPYHMAVLMGAIANGGKPVLPYLVAQVKNGIGIPVQTGHGKSGGAFLSASTADTLKEMMRGNVRDYYGDDLFPGMEVCAKTGTAQVGGGKEDTAWIVGFSANDDTPYAFSVVVEEGGFGLSTAGAIASSLMQELAS